jgi:hypothetical protein
MYLIQPISCLSDVREFIRYDIISFQGILLLKFYWILFNGDFFFFFQIFKSLIFNFFNVFNSINFMFE